MIDQATVNLHYLQAQARRIKRLEDEIKELKKLLTNLDSSAIISLEFNKPEMAKEKI